MEQAVLTGGVSAARYQKARLVDGPAGADGACGASSAEVREKKA